MLREKFIDCKVKNEAAVFVASTMEYLCAELLDIAG